MISFIEIPSDNVIGINIKGTPSDQEFDDIFTAIASKMQKHSKVRLYTEVEFIGGLTLESFFKDLKLVIPNWDKFEKEAIVTDWKWARQFSKISAKIFPEEQVQAFAFEDKETAKDWVQE